jgi:branched-chain amino acid transport system permease protein
MHRLNRYAERSWPLASLLLLVLVVSMIADFASAPLARVAVTMLINLVIVVGLFTFIGNTGVFSFGHTAFMAVGAYVTAILTIPSQSKKYVLPKLPDALASLHLPPVPGVIAGGIAASLFAGIVGIAIVRMTPLAASLATFALLAIVYNVAQNLQPVGGSSGVAGVPINTTFSAALAWGLIAIVCAFVYQHTRTCLRVKAAREDEVAARSVGAPVERDRYVAFVLSAFFVGAAGGLYAQYLGSFTPDAFFLSAAFITLVMLLVGGMTSLAGAVVGVVAISVLQEALRRVETSVDRPGIASVCLAVVLILIMIRRPLGIVGGREFSWPFVRREPAADDQLPPPTVGVGGQPAAVETR